MKKVLLAVVTAATVMTGFAASASPAQAATHDAVIKHINGSSSDRPLLVICKNWGSTSCASTSPLGTLAVGENSKTKYGWTDADGAFAPAGCTLTIKGLTQAEYFGGSSGKWIKVEGSYISLTYHNVSAFTTC
jgi:hypothetical protein